MSLNVWTQDWTTISNYELQQYYIATAISLQYICNDITLQRAGNKRQLWISKDKEIGMQKTEQNERKSMALTNVSVILRMNDI